MEETRRKPFGLSGCPVNEGNGTCGETRTLDIINEFKRLYEQKMEEIDRNCGDCLQEKLKLQQNWIADLTEQNEMLVRAVEELEIEATERVALLEDKLRKSAEHVYEVMKKYRETDLVNQLLDEPRKRVFNLENDVKNLLEFIRRARVDNVWNAGGLVFYEISENDILGDESFPIYELKDKKSIMDQNSIIESLKKQVMESETELKSSKEQCGCLQKNLNDMADMRQALTEEVALKHDTINKLKKELQELEERCIQADKQTAFRDDIIKGLRKEIKQLKQQKLGDLELESNSFKSKTHELEQKCNCYETDKIDLIHKLEEAKNTLQALEVQFSGFLEDKEKLKVKYKNAVKDGNYLKEEYTKIKCENDYLQLECDKLQKDYTECCAYKCDLEKKLDGLRSEFEILEQAKDECICRGNRVLEKNKKLDFELKREHETNKKLSATIDCLKAQLNQTNKITIEEVNRLNKTVDSLQTTLEQGQQAHEIEEKEKENEIRKLKSTLTGLENSMRQYEHQIQIKNKEISMLNESICQLKTQNSQLEHQETLKDIKNIELLETKIKNLEEYVSQLQCKSKLCKSCKQNVKVSFTDCSEVQTDTIRAEVAEHLQQLMNRDQLIKYQSEVLEKMKDELECVCGRERDLLGDRREYVEENCVLLNRISVLEKQLEEVKVLENELSIKDEIIDKQKEAVNMLQKEIETSRRKESETRTENEQYCACVQELKTKIDQLESLVENAETRGNNLQTAVDLYLNTINMLEASEDKYKLEIERQRTTISHLQDVLVTTKHELDEYKLKCDDSEEDQILLIGQFMQILSVYDSDKDELVKKLNDLSDRHENLQDLNLSLEMEHCNCLQSVQILDNQLFKYQLLLRNNEEELCKCKDNLKKLQKQKQNFEKIIEYFKTEMGNMSDQLQHLQELLNISNESTQQETNRLLESLVNVQELNDKLSTQIKTVEQKLIAENQKNVSNQKKIAQLEKLIAEKDFDIHKHTATIQCIKSSLESSIIQNKELQHTISTLNVTVNEFKDAVKQYETDNKSINNNNTKCNDQIVLCRGKMLELNSILEDKSKELSCLESAYNQQQESLKSCRIELDKFKEKHKTKQRCLKGVVEHLRQKLEEAQKENEKLRDLIDQNRGKDEEIKTYRKLVQQLKVTLVELNHTLRVKECQLSKQFVEDEEELSTIDQAEQTIEDTEHLCEIQYYIGIISSLKDATTELIEKVAQSQDKIRDLEEELQQKHQQIRELTEDNSDKNAMKEKLIETLKRCQMEEQLSKKMQREIQSLKSELDDKEEQLKDAENNAREMNATLNIEISVVREEADALREKINEVLKQQRINNIESDKLQTQKEFLQSKVSTLEDTTHNLRAQLEQYMIEMHRYQKERDSLQAKNDDLTRELRSLHVSYEALKKQKRYDEESIKDLEDKLREATETRDEICLESKNTVEYFKRWLCEQSTINKYVVTKENDYCRTIDSLRRQIQEKDRNCCNRNPDTSIYYCSLGSQGNDPIYSPPASPYSPPRPGNDFDWFASHYKNESDSEAEYENEWVTKMENLVEEVRSTNRSLRDKRDCAVTKDDK